MTRDRRSTRRRLPPLTRSSAHDDGAGKDGKVIERYLPTTTPEAIEKDIEKALA